MNSKAYFQLFCKCFGVVLIVSSIIMALSTIFTLLLLPILTWNFHFGGFMGFVKTFWQAILSAVVLIAVPGGIGYYLTSEENMFVKMCYPDGEGGATIARP